MITHETLLKRSTVLDLKLRDTISVTIEHQGQVFQGSRYTLAILDNFDHPTSINDALAGLQHKFVGQRAYLDIVGEIYALYKTGVLAEPHLATTLNSNPAAFDGIPVHVRMLSDKARTLAYQAALRELVTGEDIVVDIGTGSGILAATAAQAGAKHVYAIEQTRMADVARQVFAQNGVADRVTVIEGHSTQVELAERATIMVSELIGNDPLEERVLETTTDAQQRLLVPGANIIPKRVEIHAIGVELPTKELHRLRFSDAAIDGWKTSYGVDLSPLLNTAPTDLERVCRSCPNVKGWRRLTKEVELSNIDFRSPSPTTLDTSTQAEAIETGRLDAIVVYFRLTTSSKHVISTHPDEASPDNHWATSVWLLPKPRELRDGDSFKVDYRYRPSGPILRVGDLIPRA